MGGLGEGLVLGQEAVAGVDGAGAGVARGLQNGVGAQVAGARLGAADVDGLVARGDVAGVGVRVGIDGDGAQSHAARGGGDAAGDFAAVGNQHSIEHCVIQAEVFGKGAKRVGGGLYIRKTPNLVSSMGAFSAADNARPSTRRVSAGAMMPSSHNLAVA